MTGRFRPLRSGQILPLQTGRKLPVRPALGWVIPISNVQFIDVCLAQSSTNDHEQPLLLEGLKIGADAAIGDAKVLGQPFLTGKAIVVLPRVGEEHGEDHLVAAAELLRFEDEVGDLRKAVLGHGVRALQNDITVFEDVADVSIRREVHAGIITRDLPSRRLIPCSASMPRWDRYWPPSTCGSMSGRLSLFPPLPSNGASIVCNPLTR